MWTSHIDFFQIFEIEDEFDSALDTREYSVETSRQRRKSPSPARRPNRPSPQPQNADHTPLSPTRAVPRGRLNSILNYGAEVASPLAQIFQPLVVDEDISEESSGNPAPTGISYGPASRRRLTSIQSMPKRTTAEPTQDQSSPLRNFLLTDKMVDAKDVPLSASPNEQDWGKSTTAEQVKEQVSEAGGISQWTMRLENLEQRQERIEDLLMQISRHIKGVKEWIYWLMVGQCNWLLGQSRDARSEPHRTESIWRP